MAKVGMLFEGGAARVLFAYGALQEWYPWLIDCVSVVGGNSSGSTMTAAVGTNDPKAVVRVFNRISKSREFLRVSRMLRGKRPGNFDLLKQFGEQEFDVGQLKHPRLTPFAGYYDIHDERMIYERITSSNALDVVSRSCANPFLTPPLEGRYVDGCVLDYLPIEQFDGRNPAWNVDKLIVFGYRPMSARNPLPLARIFGKIFHSNPVAKAIGQIPERYAHAMETIQNNPDRYFYVGPERWPILPINPFADSPKVLKKLTAQGAQRARALEWELREWLGS